MAINTFAILWSLISVFSLSESQDEKTLRFENYIYEPNIRTVLLYQAGSNYPVPVIKINASETLTLSFDELSTENDYYQYTLIHCDANWQPSRLQRMEYLSGGTYADITEFKYSTNTYQKYVHYEVSIPSENVMPKLSGNYLLKVYRNFDEADIIITRKLFILDARVNFGVDIHPATISQYRFSGQEVDVKATIENYQVINPYQDLKLVISQNNRWDNVMEGIKPQFIVGNEYSYNYERENVFDGGNEFRFFDFRSLRFYSQNVRRKYFDSLNHLVLNIEEKRGSKVYYEYIDFNGKRVIANKDAQTKGDIDGDYAWIYFTLSSPSELRTGDVYVFGELTDWRKQERFKMTYNSGTGNYELKALLKQGYYSYMYITYDEQTDRIQTSETEGNYTDTENDYYLYMYCRNQSFDYDELIGFTKVNSRAK